MHQSPNSPFYGPSFQNLSGNISPSPTCRKYVYIGCMSDDSYQPRPIWIVYFLLVTALVVRKLVSNTIFVFYVFTENKSVQNFKSRFDRSPSFPL